MTRKRAAVEFVDYFRERRRRSQVLTEPPLEAFPGEDGAEGIAHLLQEVGELLDMELVLLGHLNGDHYTTVAYRARDGPSPIAKGDIIPIGETYCRQEITADAPFVLGDACVQEGFADHPGFTKYGLRAYVGVPVKLPDGTLFGTLCGVDQKPCYPSLERVERIVEIADALGVEIGRRLREGAASLESSAAPFPGSRDLPA